MPLSDVAITYHEHVVSPKNNNTTQNNISVHPGQIVANSIYNNIRNNNVINKNRNNNKLLISDPEAENIDNDHLSDVQHSADHLGM